ncbi:hypothetical protein FM038_000025 [Shewanella eurypsychrophilus]|uniref:Uncharacterized protein n=1 Tax=Shewanella eurypsychrophilus TaxID=2593656 RepID=A0ABX6V1Z4_9GAMM|nr:MULTISPECIES: hypothetical protein [Shewanella]QFU20421.1 hypothetical protein FS418_00025 [Shewanella sp. YLB-09]QPG55998.1 hypothetical protein FM038_000025 [Shewanella eurypsychrophilus]
MKLHTWHIALSTTLLTLAAYFLNSYREPQQVSLPELQLTSFNQEQLHSPTQDQIVIDPAKLQTVNELIDVEGKQVAAIHPFHIDRSNKEFKRLLAKYEVEKGAFVERGTSYFYKENDGNPYFLASPPSLNNLMFDDPDQYIELRVAEFNEIDEPYSNNWGGEFDMLDVNYHYCKVTTCLVRASHKSLAYARDYLEQFQQYNPDLNIDFTTMSSGDIVLTYSKL